MASNVPYEVICAQTGAQLTEWSQMAVTHGYSATQGKSRPYFLHLDKTDTEVAEQLRIIADAQSKLWELHDASPTSLKGKENVEKQLAMASTVNTDSFKDDLDDDYDGNVVE